MTTLSRKVNSHQSTSTSSTIQFVLRTTWRVDSKFYPEREIPTIYQFQNHYLLELASQILQTTRFL